MHHATKLKVLKAKALHHATAAAQHHATAAVKHHATTTKQSTVRPIIKVRVKR